MKNYFLIILCCCSIYSYAQNVGIGITIPDERLHVVETADAHKNVIYGFANQTSTSVDYHNTGVTGFGQGNGIPNGFGYGFGIKGIGSFNSFGAVGVYAGVGTVIALPGLGNNFYGLYANVETPAVNRHAGVFMNGNVGIGNLNPTAQLDVTGNINLTGVLRVNSISGNAGQVLVSNGASAPTWQNAANPSVGFYAVLSASQSVPNTTSTILAPYTEFFDTQNNFNASTGQFTAPAAGVYHFDVNVTYSALPASARTDITFLINGLTFGGCVKTVLSPLSAGLHAISHSITIPLTLSQVVIYQVYQATGSTVTASGGASTPTSSTFSGYRIY